MSSLHKNLSMYDFPDLYKGYRWEGKHKLFGYPSDAFPDFRWIFSLETRFAWLRENAVERKTSSRHLIREMIEWGGSQNGVLQKFDDGIGEINLYMLITSVIDALDEPEDAISAALQIPGTGLTYASKLLRFLDPKNYGALDSRVRGALRDSDMLPAIHDSSLNSMKSGYIQFLNLVNSLKDQLETEAIRKPDCDLSKTGTWRPADIEMALFRWAES